MNQFTVLLAYTVCLHGQVNQRGEIRQDEAGEGEQGKPKGGPLPVLLQSLQGCSCGDWIQDAESVGQIIQGMDRPGKSIPVAPLRRSTDSGRPMEESPGEIRETIDLSPVIRVIFPRFQ